MKVPPGITIHSGKKVFYAGCEIDEHLVSKKIRDMIKKSELPTPVPEKEKK